EIDWLIDLVTDIRAARAELRVPAGAKLALWAKDADAATTALLERYRPALERLARVASLHAGTPTADGGSLQVVVSTVTYVLPLEGQVDLAAERTRLTKEIAKLEKDVRQFEAKLANPQFVAKAPAEVVAEQTERRDEGRATLARLQAALDRIAG
ncbi:MAG: valine--tRNA ligase, partial [Geminicoccaceae bacterium]